MMLNDEERKRFCEWLRNDIYSNQQLLKAMGMIAVASPVVKMKRMLIAAEEIVLRELENVESQTIGGKPEPPDCAFFSPEDERWGKP